MIIKVTKSIFIEAFHDAGRGTQFSYEGLCALFEYLDEYEQEPDLELDVVAICCDFAEYENIEEFQQCYGDEYQSIEDIQYQTTVIEVDENRFIIAQF
jgi:hypothetical protein